MKKLIEAINMILAAKEWDEALKANLTQALEARADMVRAKEKLAKLIKLKELMK
jgi:hypothetical protein